MVAQLSEVNTMDINKQRAVLPYDNNAVDVIRPAR
jgi:hypothetical protein